MTNIEKDSYVHLDLRDGVLIASVGASSDDDHFDRAASLHGDGDYVSLWLTFPVSEVLGGTIESFVHGRQPGIELDTEAKPRIDALRAELVKMIEKIDSITYA